MPAFDLATTGGGFTSSLSFSHTTSGADRCLFVAVQVGGGPTISGVTYAGVSMTAVETGSTVSRLYALVNPASGANNVVITTSAGADIAAVAASYTGVDQTTPYDGVVSDATVTTTPSVTVTSAAANLVVGAVFAARNAPACAFTAGAGQTERGERAQTTESCAISDEAGGTSVTHSYTLDVGSQFGQRIVALNLRDVTGGGGGGGPVIATPSVVFIRARDL